MPVTINGTSGVITPEVVLDNNTADGGQVVLSSSGFSNWNLDNFSGRLRAYYGSTEYLTLTNAGNLGIGTSSPATKLHVNGKITATGVATGANSAFTLDLNAGTAFNTNGAAIALRGSTAGYNDNGMEFYAGNTERARIDSSGNLLVGKTSTANNATGFYVAGSGNADHGMVSVARPPNTTMIQIVNSSGNTVVGQISQNGSNTTYSTSSDYRLKENIAPMTGALSRVAALKPCVYTWKATGETDEGFIAHELQEVCPSAVTGEKDAVNEDGSIKPQGIDTSFLVATLTAAIQELHAQHIELKALVDQQATEIANLKGQA